MKSKNFGDRPKRQDAEKYSEVTTDLPEGRFQGEKQVLTPDELGGANAPVAGNASGGDAEKAAIKIKSKLKVAPDASVEMLEGKQVGGVPLEGGLVTRSVAGVLNVSPADDTSKTPYQAGGYRPSTRYGKKRSEDLFELDNAISEQIAPVYEDALDLREAPDAVQGYNGRKQFKQARGKKNAEQPPQGLLQEASVDFRFDDSIIHTTGQVIEGVDSQADYPTTAFGSSSTPGVPVAVEMKKGNYLLKNLKITVANEKIAKVEFDETKYVVKANPLDRDEANMNWQTDANKVAKAMVRMQKELGRETTDKWSPLAYVIEQPYQYNMLCHDIEATTGALAAIAYRAAVSSLSFQRNLVSKEGIGPQASAIRMILEGYLGDLAASEILPSKNFSEMIWNRWEYKAGSPAAIIAMFDSTAKYRTKADLLGMQRSFSLHLSQADNNLDPLHAKAEFLKALNKEHTFSTVSGTYNPMLPIYATKRIKVFNPMSLNVFLKGWKNPADLTAADRADVARDQETGTLSQYGYTYADIRNSYTTRVQHPIVEGLLKWLLKHEGAFVRTFGDGETIIPCDFNFTAPGLFQFMLCSALMDVNWERNITFRDILFAGEQSTYIWDDLVSLKDADPLHSTQLTITGYNQDLKLGKLAPDKALRLMWGDHMQYIADSSSGTGGHRYAYFAPWYMNEHAFGKAGSLYTASEGFKREESSFNMTIPSIRDGVRHEYVDIIKSMSERDVRLAMDRYITIPTFTQYTSKGSSGSYDVVTPSTSSTDLNAYITVQALRYEHNSDGRIAVQYDLTAGSGTRQLCQTALLCVPKELGFIWTMPGAMLRPITALSISSASANSGDIVPTYAFTASVDTDPLMGGSATSIRSYRVAAAGLTSGAIDRSAALTQAYKCAFATRQAVAVNNAYTEWTHMALSSSYNNGSRKGLTCFYNVDSTNSAPATFIPGTQLNSSTMTIWPMLQRFFAAINPFENCYLPTGGTTSDLTDPLEEAFYFGVCGTLASDYTQDVLERLDTYDQLGMDYTEDTFIAGSLIFREN